MVKQEGQFRIFWLVDMLWKPHQPLNRTLDTVCNLGVLQFSNRLKHNLFQGLLKGGLQFQMTHGILKCDKLWKNQ